MSTASEWTHHHVWPEIEAMMFKDAHFRLVLEASRLTKKFNGPTAKLLQGGYLHFCDGWLCPGLGESGLYFLKKRSKKIENAEVKLRLVTDRCLGDCLARRGGCS